MSDIKNMNMSAAFNHVSKHKITQNILYNIGACLDIPTGSFQIGKKGETITNGGLNKITAIIGPGNSFKSTILHYMALRAADIILESNLPTMINTYDTEINTDLNRCQHLASNFKHLPEDVFSSGLWNISNKSIQDADDWIMEIETLAKNKEKNKNVCEYVCFSNPYNKEEGIKTTIPTFVEIDSLSELEPESTKAMLEDGIDSSDTNTYYLKQGLYKNKIMSKLPVIAGSTNTYILMTAQIGSTIDIATGPAKYQQSTKKLQYLKAGDAIKGVSNKFFYLINTLWFADTAIKFINQNTKEQEYPSKYGSSLPEDLNIVKLKLLRSKTGLSGIVIEIIISQQDGVLPDLTNFHNIKENNRFGISGSLTNYYLDLYPNVKLSRTTVRDKLREDKLLARACEITSDMLQLYTFHSTLIAENDLQCTPAELYEDIKKMGYDWNILLNTRNYWTINQYTNKVPFLSTMDLLKMRKNLYYPYFLDENKKLRKEYT